MTERFAFDRGLKSEPTLTPEHKKWGQDVKPLLGSPNSRLLDLVAQLTAPRKEAFDTIIMVASDGQGLSSASSTSGYTGEMAMRAGIARHVVTQSNLKKGVHEAVQNAVKDLSALTGGLIGGVTICSGPRWCPRRRNV
jgi:isoaspartyl peptidase/L-asparaginase-like protein (Ntn-hydrolase superfamily)